MPNINTDLILLENLSKQISDLISQNNFKKVPHLDSLRQSIIQNTYLNKKDDLDIKDKIKKLINENDLLILASESKLKNLNKNHTKFHKRLTAYSKS